MSATGRPPPRPRPSSTGCFASRAASPLRVTNNKCYLVIRNECTAKPAKTNWSGVRRSIALRSITVIPGSAKSALVSSSASARPATQGRRCFIRTPVSLTEGYGGRHRRASIAGVQSLPAAKGDCRSCSAAQLNARPRPEMPDASDGTPNDAAKVATSHSSLRALKQRSARPRANSASIVDDGAASRNDQRQRHHQRHDCDEGRGLAIRHQPHSAFLRCAARLASAAASAASSSRCLRSWASMMALLGG